MRPLRLDADRPGPNLSCDFEQGESGGRMLYVDVPTLSELKALIAARADACVSIYVTTTPLTQQVSASRIAYGNLLRKALAQLEEAGCDKRRAALLEADLSELAEDDEFWRLQARTLAVLATPGRVRTYRLATAVTDTVQVSDRFHLKPLLRAVAFPQTAFVLALSENDARLVEIFADHAPSMVRVPGLPKSASDSVGRSSVNNLTQNTRLSNAEGQNKLLRQYARQLDGALRGVLAGRDTPLILAATEPLASIFRGLCSSPALIQEGIAKSPDRLSEEALASAARPVLDRHYQDMIKQGRALYDARSSDRRATTNVGEAARAATNGAIEFLMIDIDHQIPGTISETDGAVTFASGPDASTYDVVDEIAGRAILTGARFLGVRKSDIPSNAPLAAILRYPI